MRIVISATSVAIAEIVARHLGFKDGAYRWIHPRELDRDLERNSYDCGVLVMPGDDQGQTLALLQEVRAGAVTRWIAASLRESQVCGLLEVSRLEAAGLNMFCPNAGKAGHRSEPDVMANWIGCSAAAGHMRSWLPKIAACDCSVLLTGETGTGKELAAELIHRASSRRNRPFVCLNCAAIPETLLESELFGYERGAFTGAFTANDGKLHSAHGGTLFLDEIGDMSLLSQAKILRALESREVQRLGSHQARKIDVRVIAGTNQDLRRLMREGRFRSDLFYRLGVAHVELAPLRERSVDVPLLLQHFLAFFNHKLHRRLRSFAPDVVERLSNYDWPGNVRELRNVVESVFISATDDMVHLRDLPANFAREYESECDRLLHVLQETKGNKSEAAKRMNCSRMTLYRRLARMTDTAQRRPRDDFGQGRSGAV